MKSVTRTLQRTGLLLYGKFCWILHLSGLIFSTKLFDCSIRIPESRKRHSHQIAWMYKTIRTSIIKKIIFIYILNWFQFSSDQIVQTKFAHPIVNWIDVIRVTIAFLKNSKSHKFLQTIILFVQRNIDFVVTSHSQLKITYWYNFGMSTWTI